MLNALRSRWTQSLQNRISRLPGHSASVAAGSTLPPPAPRAVAAGVAGQIPLSDVLPQARAAFERCLDGLDGEGLVAQRRAIRHACSLQDFWHLRTGLYNEIARQLSQAEAEQRLATLHPLFD